MKCYVIVFEYYGSLWGMWMVNGTNNFSEMTSWRSSFNLVWWHQIYPYHFRCIYKHLKTGWLLTTLWATSIPNTSWGKNSKNSILWWHGQFHILCTDFVRKYFPGISLFENRTKWNNRSFEVERRTKKIHENK